MPSLDSQHTPAQFDPYSLPAEHHGWRGPERAREHKRKWWRLPHDKQVLVTALPLTPGEQSVCHSHESGELPIAYNG